MSMTKADRILTMRPDGDSDSEAAALNGLELELVQGGAAKYGSSRPPVRQDDGGGANPGVTKIFDLGS